MDQFVFFLVTGLCSGALIALIALGYTLVYGIIKLINFAHGEFFMVGAYAGWGLWALAFREGGLSPWASVPLLLVAGGGAGAVIAVLTERIAYKPIRASGRLAALLTAIGVSFLLQNLFYQVRNGNPQTFAGPLARMAQRGVEVGGSGIKAIQFATLPVTLLLALGLWAVVMKTRFGAAMRAVSQDREAASLMGIDTDAVIRNTFLLGGFLAGVGGVLVGLQSVVEPMMGFMPGLKAFVAAVVGGIGSIPGALVGGVLIGLVENLALWGGVPSGYRDVAAFLILIVVLVVRPQGILGRSEREKV